MKLSLTLFLLLGGCLMGTMFGQNPQTENTANKFLIEAGGARLVSCESESWPKVSDCKLAENSDLTAVINAVTGEVDRLQKEQARLMKYDDVCASWGRWHYRKGVPFKSDGHGGGSVTSPDRWRRCLCYKPIFQEEPQ